ncbi:conserved Plasmodium protein, unknown function [Plasmodium relictum]|uniref:Uncharacterized protein n=1 Tax=Plasmodium relictum TaxID=85471 RepID=A0A1J1HAA1_PLARL|nr:conserved Plasmodium protein, unknown function [Plasmodium relictum]CRH00362.1 conserved Plasmodium protein, unknown function [Plasmodium relictum]
MIKKSTNLLSFDYYLINNGKYSKIWATNIFKKYIHLANIYYSFIHKNKKINTNIYNMNCVELYKYSCFLQKGNINNENIYKKINRRVEMIYKFLIPSKIILLIKLYLENANLNVYHNTFNCLIEGTITKLNEFNLEEIVKMYSIISKMENNQNITYLFKYFNNHLINNYTFIDVKSFSIILNSHAKLKIRDIKLINKFLNIILENKLSFDIINYSIFFNSFYKLRIIDNDYIEKIVKEFLNELDVWRKCREQKNLENDHLSSKEKLIINKFINYYPHHICNILLFFTIFNINKISNINNSKEIENEINFNDNIYINFLLELLIEKKNLLRCEEILILCQVLKSFKIKNDILIDHIEKELLNYFNYIKEEKKNFNRNNEKLKNVNNIIQFSDGAVIKILFDLCTFYNDINIYRKSVQFFLQKKKKVDFNSSSLLLYIYSEINHLDYKMLNLLISVLNKNYLKNFQIENVFLLIRSFYKFCLNNQHYFVYDQIKENNILDTNKNSTTNNISNSNAIHPCELTTVNNSNNYDNKNYIYEDIHKNNIMDNKETHCSNEDYFTEASNDIDDIFYKIHKLSNNIFTKLEEELLEKKIELNESNISQLCKILYYSVFLRKFAFLNNVINLFINKEDINGFKNILNILYSYSYIKNNLYFNFHEINLIKVNKNCSKECDTVLKNYNFIINKRGYINELKNMIYFIFIQCKLNDYNYVNVDIISILLNSFFLNIHLLSILLNSLICKELSILINFAKDNGKEKLSKICSKDICDDLKNDTFLIIKNIDNFHYMKLYNKIFMHINKHILKCQNIYDITRIFNSSFILLSYIEKCRSENKLDDDVLQGEKHIHSILKKIEKNLTENYSLYNKEFIILLSAISIYSNNYFYIPFSFFFEYFNLYVFKNFISYLILLSNDEEIKYISNSIFSLTNYYSNCNKYNKKQDIEDFYTFHISQIINSVKNNNNLNSFKINNIMNIYKLMVNNNNILNNTFFKKIKDLYIYSLEINSILLNNLSLNELNNLCLLLVKKKEPNTFLFKYTLKKNYEYVNLKNEILSYDYIINLLNIYINFKKYNFSINDQMIINIILKNIDNFQTLHEINTLLQNIYLIKTINVYNNLIRELCYHIKKIYMNYFLNNETINLNKVVYLLYLLNNYDNSEIFYNMFQIFFVKFFKLSKIIVYQKKKYNFVNSLTNTFFMAKNIYSLNENVNINLDKDLKKNNLNDEYIIYLNDNLLVNNIITDINEPNNAMKKNKIDMAISESTSKLECIDYSKVKESLINYDNNKYIYHSSNEIDEIKDKEHMLYINDYTFIILFLLLDIIRNEKRIESIEICSFIFKVFKNYIYFLNKEVIIECLYIYFFSQINNELSQEYNKVKLKNFNDDQIHYVLNILITFTHNLEIYSILKLSFIYINLFFFSQKNYQVKENIKILFEHINRKKDLIEKNNILYDQLKKYENISNH